MSRVVFLLLSCLAGCATSVSMSPSPPQPLAAAFAAGAFPGIGAVLEGFDAASDDPEWAAGDRLLFGLQLSKDGEERRWLMRLEVVRGRLPKKMGEVHMHDGRDYPSIEVDLNSYSTMSYSAQVDGEERSFQRVSLALPVAVTVYDEAGKQLGSSQVSLPAEVLSQGLLDAVDLARAHPQIAAGDAFKAEDMRQLVDSYMSMMSLLNIVQDDSVLAQYFWQVVEKPSIWSALTHFGVQASIDMQLQSSIHATAMPAALPACDRAMVVPVRIDVNGSPALSIDVLATDPRRPFALCGGMVAASAHHPSDPSLHFDVQLLAARLASVQ